MIDLIGMGESSRSDYNYESAEQYIKLFLDSIE